MDIPDSGTKEAVMKKLIYIGIFLTVSAVLFSDDKTDAAGEDPDIVLPPMFLEIRDLTKEEVRTALPGTETSENIVLPELTVPMPDPTETGFDETGIDAFLAEIGEEGAMTPSGKKSVKVFPVAFDARAALGTVGEIGLGFSVFGNTEKSSYRFSAGHNSRDGYGFRPWGGAFFDRSTLLSGEYAFRNHTLTNETGFSFESRDFGTQNMTTGSDTRRDLLFSADDRFSLNAGSLRFGASVGLDLLHRYTDEVGNGATDLFLEPRAVLDLMLPKTKLTFAAGYAWNGSFFDRNNGHSADFLFEFDTELPQAVNLAGGVGLFWDGRERASVYGTDLLGFSVPFYLMIYGSAADFFQYRFKGGFENERRSYASLGEEFRYLNPTALSALSGWFAEAELDFRIRRLALISVGLDFDRKSGTVLIEERKTNADGLIPVSQKIQNLLYGFVKTRLNPVEGLEMAIGWEGSLLPENRYYLKARHSVDGMIGYTIPQKWFTFGSRLLFEVYDKAYIPEWDLNALFTINEHFRLSLTLDDLLSPIYKEGRPTVWGGYIAPGLGASVCLEIKY